VAPYRTTGELRELSLTQKLARSALVTFLLTFIAARASALLATTDWFPALRVQLWDTHIHHLNFGIALLSLIGGYLLFVRPGGRALAGASWLYGVGLALTFDEFGMWLNLNAAYWQRASFDAVVVIAGLLGLIVAGPALRRFRTRHWATMAGFAVVVTLFAVLVLKPLWSEG